MKITILNGNPSPENTVFDGYLQGLVRLLENNKHHVHTFVLREMDIKYCTGCFGCWIKEPGYCIIEDDSAKLRRQFISSDFALFASPIIMGFISAILKKTQDKLIPLLLPYFELIQGEIHHQARYDSYPRLGLLLENRNETDDEDIRIITDIYKRTAINLHTKLCLTGFIDNPVEELASEINSI
jgi:multimeric flavodoxin WrbA